MQAWEKVITFCLPLLTWSPQKLKPNCMLMNSPVLIGDNCSSPVCLSKSDSKTIKQCLEVGETDRYLEKIDSVH